MAGMGMVSSVDRGEAAEDWTGGRWTTESLVSRSEQIQHPNDDDRSSSNNQNDTVILPSIQQHTHHQQQSAAGAPFRIQHTNETGNPHFTSNVDSRGRMIQTAAQHHHRHHLRRRRRSCTCSLSDHCPSSKFWRCSCPRYTSNKQHSSIRMRIRMGLLLQMLLLLFHRRGEAAAASNNAFQLEPNTTNNNNPATQIWFIPPLDDNDESSSNNSNARNVPVGIPIQIPVGPPTQKPSTLKPTFLRFTPTPSNTLTMTTLEPTTLTTRNDQSSSPRSLRPSVGVMSQSPSARPIARTNSPTTLGTVENTNSTNSSSGPTATILRSSTFPSLWPSAVPTIPTVPTQGPTPPPTSTAPSNEPSDTPSDAPSGAPSLEGNATTAPQVRQFVNATVPFNVTVVLQLLLDDAISNDSRERTIQDLLDQVATIWKLSLLDFADTAFVDRSDVSVWDADLDVVQKEPSPPQQQNNLLLQHRQARILWRKRRAQNANDDFLEVNVLGGLDIAVDELTLSPEAFVGRAETELESSFFSADELQRALDDDVAENGNSLPLAVVSEVPPPDLTDGDDESDRDTSESPSDKPSTASIVLGFTLLAATLVSLMFWSHVLWKKYKKEKRKRHLDSLRQAQSVTYQTERSSAALSMQQQNKRSQKEHQKQQIEQHMPIRTVTSEGSASSAYPGLATSDDDNEIERELDDDISSTLSDQFARELQLAASFDRATWGEVQRKKKLLKIQNGEPRSTTLVSSSIGIANARNVHMFGAMGSEDMGLEVEPQTGVSSYQGSFPYGDENARNNLSKLAPMRLDADNAVKWTATGVSQAAAAHATTNGTMKERSLKNETKPFSPYGEEKEKEVRRLEKSWDLDTYPVKDERVPLQYSFLHPLRGRALNEDVPDARHSPSSEASVHESLEVTSVGTNADSSVQEAMRSTTGKEKDDVESESAVTESMLKEIEEIANYVKNYEKQKQYRKSESKEIHSSDDSGRPLNVLSGSRSIQTIQYKVMNDSISLQAAAESLSMALPPPRTSPVHVRSLQSKRSEESSPNAFSDVEEDDSSQRLGISRISVEKPPGHLLSYKSSQDDPLQYNLSSLESGSLFPSSDIDSLRYSPSHSFERQTSNVPMTSLLDGPSHRLSADESEDDNGPMPLTVGRNVADILRDLGTNPSEFSLPHPSARDARRGVDFRSHGNDRSKQPTQQQQQQQHHYDSDDEGFNNVSLPPSSTIRSKDQNFNHIRSYFEANRTPPIVPPNESWQYEGSLSGGKGISDPSMYSA